MYKAVIFDRDGTLNRTTRILRAGQKEGDQTDGYVLTPAELEIFPAAKPALTLLRENGILPFVFTQQNCIAKGLVTEKQVETIHNHMNDMLGPESRIEAFYLAGNKVNDSRAKPNPAMIFEIMDKYGFSKEEVLVVGDSMRDYQAAIVAAVAFAWVQDDLNRVSREQIEKTGCPIFADVLELTEKYILKVSEVRQSL